MSFPRYPTYKDSGVGWLGEVPAKWQLLPFWTMFRRTKRTGYQTEQLLSVYRDHGVVPKSSRDDNNNKPSEDLSPYQLVEPGDLAINKMKAWQGSVAISEHRGIVSPAYFVYSATHSHHPRFLHYLLRSPQYITGYLSLSKGIRVNQWDLEPEDHSRMPVLLPDPAEQAAIADFLDHETAKIDALVAEQERLIELLKEKRQAVISHAVTKGLDPSVLMKDSGVEWLSEVPAHWNVGKVKQFFATTSGSTPHTDRQDVYYNGEIPWIRSLDLTDGEITEWEIGITPAAIEDTACKVLPIGTVLVAMYGGDGTIGKNGLLRIPATTNQAICAILPSPQFDPAFVLAFMQHQRPYWMVGAEGTRKDPNISQDRVRNAVVLCPPLAEQEAICEHLGKAASGFRALEKEADIAINLLLERRTALISAAVTGQIDVRGWVTAESAA